MKEERVLNVLGQVDEAYVEEADPMNKKMISYRRRSRRALIAVAVVAALLISSFTVAMAASEEFRNIVFNFFHIETSDVVLPVKDEPEQSGNIEHISSTTIDDAVTVEYIRMDGTFDYANGIVYLYEDGAPTAAYAVANEQLALLEAHHESLEYVWNGLAYSVNFNWYENGGIVYASVRDYDMDTSAAWIVRAIEGITDCVAVTISFGQQIEYTELPLLYDLNSHEIIGLFDGCEELQSRQINHTEIAPDLSGVLASCDLGTDWYYYDVQMKTLLSLNELCNKKLKDAWFIDNNTVCCLFVEKDGTYTCGRVDLTAKSYTENFAAVPELDDTASSGIVLIGGRYGLLVNPERSTFVYDFKTGEQAIVDGFKYPDDDTFATLNRTGDKLLFTKTDDNVDGLGISEIGVLDLKARTFTLFDRENYDTRREISVGWFDEDTVAIQASTEEFGYLYLFTVKGT